MPAPKFLSALPKPLLFGLYGAVGGLIGAIFFGEPAWRLLKPPPPPPVPQLAVGSAAAVTLYPGTSNTFVVRVARDNFEGPVTVKFEKLPDGVAIPPITIPADKDSGEAQVTAAPTATVGKKPPTTVAASVDNPSLSATASVEVEIVAIPPPPPDIALAVPSNLNIFKRGTSRFTATVARREYNGPVTVTVGPLPAGITMPPTTIPPGETSVEVVLTAADAALGDVPLKVTAEVPERKDVPRREQPVSLKVEKPPIAPVDVVFVLDVTASMQWAIDDLKNGIGKFADKLAKEQIPFRLALVTFQDVTVVGEKVEVVTFKSPDGGESPFTSNAGTFRDRLSDLKARGGGDIPESSPEALAEAAKLPFRQGASRMVLLVTDAPPKFRPGTPAGSIDAVVKLVKEGAIDSVHVVVQKLDLEAYRPLLTAGTGKPTKPFDLKDVVLSDDGFDALLGTFGEEVAAAAVAKAPDAKPSVAPPPAPPTIGAATTTATPKGTEAPPPPSVKGVQSSAQFAAGTEGRLTLAIGVWTGAIAALVCLFLMSGQHHYLRGSLPGVGSALLGVIGGLVVGLAGGAAGQGLFFLAPESETQTLAHVFRVLGWSILGALAGIGLSFFVPNMKWWLGLVGGAIGGAAGAAGFIAVSSATGDLVGRLVGGLILGFCIGLMVAIVEAAFRRAWLEVRFGERETVTVTLGPEPVKIGGDAKACTVWGGAPPVAVRFFVRDGQVVCDDAIMGRETAVADGYEKDVGNVKVTVRTGSGAAAPAPARPVPPPRPVQKPAAMTLDDDDGFDLPMPVKPSAPRAPAPAAQTAPKPAAPAQPPAPPRPPAPTAAPPKPPVPATPQTAAPAPPKPATPAAPPVPAAKPPVPSGAPAKPGVPVSSSKPALPGIPPKPPAPAAPPAAAPKPPAPPTAAPPAAKPAIKSGARDPNACPGCGRVIAGSPGTRYCMVCDQSF